MREGEKRQKQEAMGGRGGGKGRDEKDDRRAYLLTGALIPWLSLPRPSPSFQPIFISIRKPRFSTVSLNSLYSE